VISFFLASNDQSNFSPAFSPHYFTINIGIVVCNDRVSAIIGPPEYIISKLSEYIELCPGSKIELPLQKYNYHLLLSPSNRPDSVCILSMCFDRSALSLNFD
jgi:hypothetical protein